MDDVKKKQKEDRDNRLKQILASGKDKKIIVAGAGTGKTFTLGELLKSTPGDNKIVLTFIRRLVTDMELKLSAHAKLYTFHKYCKFILHSKVGKFEIIPYLDGIIENDALLLEHGYIEFGKKFENLEEGEEINFYIQRGDYYRAISFNDSVYRLLKISREDPGSIPTYTQIIIDEFQDFNLLEVSLIDELEKRSPILIVGDDDQAVYSGRSSSPDFLRRKYHSGIYEKFELPYSTRCTDVIVKATNAIIKKSVDAGLFPDRIDKEYECFIQEKEADNIRYPKITTAEVTNVRTLVKYVLKEINNIPKEDIDDSYKEGGDYPTALIIGPKQYLKPLVDKLREELFSVEYSPNEEITYGIVDAYKELNRDKKSNLGFRILIEIRMPQESVKTIIEKTVNGTKIIDLLEKAFIEKHLRALEVVKLIVAEDSKIEALKKELKELEPTENQTLIDAFTKKEEVIEETDKSKPNIMLASFMGAKGLSAGHVFIVGANNGSLPKNSRYIKPIEASQFIVALTRTRKRCHIVSNTWLFAPKNRNGTWAPKFQKSGFISWIPTELIDDKGYLKASDIS